MLILMAGLPGTGKSALSRALAAELGGTVIDKDHIRAGLFDPADIEYSTEQDEFCMRVMLKVAGYLGAILALVVVALFVWSTGRTSAAGVERQVEQRLETLTDTLNPGWRNPESRHLFWTDALWIVLLAIGGSRMAFAVRQAADA